MTFYRVWTRICDGFDWMKRKPSRKSLVREKRRCVCGKTVTWTKDGKRPLKHICIDEVAKEKLMEDARDILNEMKSVQ